MNTRPASVAILAAMPLPATKASSIRVLNIARALVARYPDVTVNVFGYAGTGDGELDPRVNLVTVEGFDATKTRYYGWGNKLPADWKLLWALIRRRSSIDLLHCHTYEGLAIGLAFKVLTFSPAPVCVDIHGPFVPELVHYNLIPNKRPVIALFALLERFLLRYASHVFVSNEGLKSQLSSAVGEERVTVVFDYVDSEKFAGDRVDPAKVRDLLARIKPAGERIVAYVGMFKDYQGVDYLIRAFAELARDDSSLVLLLVGEGPCRERYEALISEMGLGYRIFMPGLVPHAEVINYLEVADVVVSPRVDNEITRAGFVSQMPEYMAAGKLIVSTSVSGCRLLLRDGAGILVDANSVESLRSGLAKALRLPPDEVELSSANARRNVARFTWSEGIADVRRVYDEVLRERLDGHGPETGRPRLEHKVPR